jgi:TnpA family transposase
MKTSKPILGLKNPIEFSFEERKLIIEEYLSSGCKKRDIWEKYTGRTEEHGHLLRWMRQLGYQIAPRFTKLASNKSYIMPKKLTSESIAEIQLKEKIKQLEQALINSELRATALETMIEVAEKSLHINIRKKSNTKPSSK